MTWVMVGVTGGSALLGYLGQKKQPKQQTQTESSAGTSSYNQGQVIDPLARANIGYGLQQSQDAYRSGSTVSPVFGQAQGAIGRGLMGQQNFGGYQARQVNPYADLAFTNAANATQNRLTGEFARSGRNLEAAQPARSMELQNLAAGIYGPAYEAEAQRQYGSQEGAAQRGLSAYQGALGSSPFFSQTGSNLGLDQYLQRVQGLAPMLPSEQYGTSSQTGSGAQTQPIYSNPLAGAAGGALLGQQIFGGFMGGGGMWRGNQPWNGGIPDSSGYRIPGT